MPNDGNNQSSASKIQFKDKTTNISLRLHLNSKGVSVETLLDENNSFSNKNRRNSDLGFKWIFIIQIPAGR